MSRRLRKGGFENHLFLNLRENINKITKLSETVCVDQKLWKTKCYSEWSIAICTKIFYCAQWKNSNFQNFCWMIKTQPIPLLKQFLLYLVTTGWLTSGSRGTLGWLLDDFLMTFSPTVSWFWIPNQIIPLPILMLMMITDDN